MTAGPGATVTLKDNIGILPVITVIVPFSMTMMSYITMLLPATHAYADELMVTLTAESMGTNDGPPLGHVLLVSSTNSPSERSFLPVKVDLGREKILTRTKVDGFKTKTLPPKSIKDTLKIGNAAPDASERLVGKGVRKTALATSPDALTL